MPLPEPPKEISIHAPRAGGDLTIWVVYLHQNISIHAPRAGGDGSWHRLPSPYCNFNPRPPCGGRPYGGTGGKPNGGFQSTPPVRGATADVVYDEAGTVISIHAPVRGATLFGMSENTRNVDFNPRPPCGGRQLV